ncbi:MAG: PDGLE domain-containing protein [Candidatus Moraniibacteriota bacterium]
MQNNWKRILIVSLFIGGGLSLLASSSPDGLEKVAAEQGFLEQGRQLFTATIPDYMMPGIQNEPFATSLAGIIGTLSVFLILFFAGKVLYRTRCGEEDTHQPLTSSGRLS